MSEIDYKALLEKYIQHVADCEGTDFLGHHLSLSEDFTEQEKAALREAGHRQNY